MNSQHKPEKLASYSSEMLSAMLMYFLKLFPPSTQTPPHLLSASPDSCPSASWHCPCIDSASCRHRMVPKRPCATPVCLTSAGKEMLTVIPITGFGFKQGDPGQFRGRATLFTLPYRYLGYVQGHGWHGISLVHVWWGASLQREKGQCATSVASSPPQTAMASTLSRPSAR